MDLAFRGFECVSLDVPDIFIGNINTSMSQIKDHEHVCLYFTLNLPLIHSNNHLHSRASAMFNLNTQHLTGFSLLSYSNTENRFRYLISFLSAIFPPLSFTLHNKQIQCTASIHHLYEREITKYAEEDRAHVYSPSLSYLSEEEYKLKNCKWCQKWNEFHIFKKYIRLSSRLSPDAHSHTRPCTPRLRTEQS